MNIRLDSDFAPVKFQKQAQKYGSRGAVGTKINGVYHEISWDALNRQVTGAAKYLLSVGIGKGDRVAIFSPTRYEWWVADMAVLSVGAVSVPVHATNSPEETAYVLTHSGSRICFAAEDESVKLDTVAAGCAALEKIILFGGEGGPGRVTLEEAMSIGTAYDDRGEMLRRVHSIEPDDIATIMYTSGTTGNPKGVMLTHDNFRANVQQVYSEIADRINEDDLFLSFMPLSHSLERTCGYYFPVYAGCRVYFAESLATILEDLNAVRPTLLISAPRIYERVRSIITGRIAEESVLKRAVFRFAEYASRKNLPIVCGKSKPGAGAPLSYRIAEKLVFSKLKQALGLDRLKFAISGGGPLSIADAEFFLGMGLVVLEGYGLTETTPVANFNRPWMIRPGTVGPAAPETQIRIAEEDGEVLIKGPQVMKGYYREPEATAAAFDRDGSFKTGDLGMIDDEGCLHITGRIKDIIVTSGGKNISPQNIENSVRESSYIEHIAVIGDKRKYLSALVIPDFDRLRSWAASQKIDASDKQGLIENERVISLIAEEIERQTGEFSRLEHIRRFTLLSDVWSQDNGIITPSLKVKRREVEKKYANAIEAMYAEE